MPGFNISIGPLKFNTKKTNTPNIVYDDIIYEGINIQQFTLNRFLNDKCFVETEDFIIVLEGVIYNKKEILIDSLTWAESLINLYKIKGEHFFKTFRGSFSGVLIDKKNNKSYVFTDHLGTKNIYYYKDDESFIVSSEIRDIYKTLKSNNIEYHLDENASQMLLTYGYMLEDFTLCDKIKKVRPGTVLTYNQNSLIETLYYKLPLSTLEGSINESEVIDTLDAKFKLALSRQFDKDIEYNYKHFVGLSGGLDSRMTSWVAHQMGYENQLNFTFSQSNYLDETIPKQIASDLKHEWIFKTLDNGLFLKDIEEVTKLSGGNVLYYGLAHSYSLLNNINFRGLGIVHTGQLGDIIISSYIKNLNPKSLESLGGNYSKISKKSPNKSFKSFQEKELAMIYQRGLNGINNGLLSYQAFTETASPFYDIDFFEYCLSIPIKSRMKHNLYFKWINNKYPDACEYIWESTKLKPGRNYMSITLKGRKIPLRKIPLKLLQLIGIRKVGLSSSSHMNPLDYWYNTNSNLKKFQDEYFNNGIKNLKSESLIEQCTNRYAVGNAIEKNQILSLLAANNLFFSE
ncbi:hypothetical protein [Croceibacter atlanticus]|uniref:hypothetical protein n=1 Tax=Croceibacter atlanticus TaxID=313588 RepID=UPI0024BB5578|nr:hypothetical protein [Croceibacter atlanticus]